MKSYSYRLSEMIDNSFSHYMWSLLNSVSEEKDLIKNLTSYDVNILS